MEYCQIENAKTNICEQNFIDTVSFEIYLNNKRAEKNRSEVKYNFGNCKICNDKATGIHFGICTCEGCKGFFRRSLTKHKKYRCRNKTQSCEIRPKQRKKCRLCRWNACINAGMSIKSVKMGRIPNSMKQTNLSCIKSNDLPNKKLFFCLSLKNLAKQNKIDYLKTIDTQNFVPRTTLTEGFLNNSSIENIIIFSLLRDKSFQIFREQTLEFEIQERKALKILETDCKKVTKTRFDRIRIAEIKRLFMVFLKTHAYSMFRILSDLPCFKEIKEKDLNTIIKRNFFSILTLRTLKLFLNDDYFLMLDSRTQLNRELYSIILDKKVCDHLFDYVCNLKSLNLGQHEISLLVPFFLSIFSKFNKRLIKETKSNHEILCFSKNNIEINDNLEDPYSLREINKYYTEALYYEFNINRRTNEFMEKLVKVVHVAHEINEMCLEIQV
uniref:Nuclear receptor n=1 Tax=Brachionus calyciflorus TaxID=104777 RepID=A0A221CB21_9BILA|nr:nuclear receptor [Brachionus calyciflorus]